jgi:hypothetical protein
MLRRQSSDPPLRRYRTGYILEKTIEKTKSVIVWPLYDKHTQAWAANPSRKFLVDTILHQSCPPTILIRLMAASFYNPKKYQFSDYGRSITSIRVP